MQVTQIQPVTLYDDIILTLRLLMAEHHILLLNRKKCWYIFIFIILHKPLIHLAYIVNAKNRDIWNNKVTVLNAYLADANCLCKMTPVMALDGVISF